MLRMQDGSPGCTPVVALGGTPSSRVRVQSQPGHDNFAPMKLSESSPGGALLTTQSYDHKTLFSALRQRYYWNTDATGIPGAAWRCAALLHSLATTHVKYTRECHKSTLDSTCRDAARARAGAARERARTALRNPRPRGLQPHAHHKFTVDSTCRDAARARAGAPRERARAALRDPRPRGLQPYALYRRFPRPHPRPLALRQPRRLCRRGARPAPGLGHTCDPPRPVSYTHLTLPTTPYV